MDIKSILIEWGIRPTRRLGQYFLVDDAVANRMVAYAAIDRSDVVLEIGAGVGSLTEKLARTAKKVYAVEKDSTLCELLRAYYGGEPRTTEILEGDVMKIELPDYNKVVASIPFLLSSPLTYKLLLHPAGFGSAVLLYQKEFAQKLIAKPRSSLYGRVSVIAQALADPELLDVVPRDAFYPPSPVKTAIVRLNQKKEPVAALVEDKRGFFEFVTAAFEQRRKKMRTIFKKRLPAHVTLAELDKRPEELSPVEFVQLATYF